MLEATTAVHRKIKNSTKEEEKSSYEIVQMKKSSGKNSFVKKIVVNCLNFRKLKLKLELKWNFEFFKIEISDLKIYSVTLDISKNQNRSTGG